MLLSLLSFSLVFCGSEDDTSLVISPPVLGDLALDESIDSSHGAFSLAVAVTLTSEGSVPIRQTGFLYSQTEASINDLDMDNLDLDELPLGVVRKSVANAHLLTDGNVIQATLSSLSENTSYHIRAYVITRTMRILSNTLNVSTKIAPVLGAISLDESVDSNRGISSLSVVASLSSRGSDPISQAGFIYSDTESSINSLNMDNLDISALNGLMHAPLQDPSSLADGSVIQSTLSSLSGGTIYYIRAYVINSAARVLSDTLDASTLIEQSPFQLSLDTESTTACLNASTPPLYTCILISPPATDSTIATFSIQGGTACASPNFTATSTIDGDTPMVTDSPNPQLQVTSFGLSATQDF